MGPLGVIFLFVVAAVAFRLIAGGLDGDRVEAYVRERGWELVDRSWEPFGPGWFGEKNARIYQIRYRDQQGHLHRAHVKTSMLSGVYLSGDEIVERAPTESEDANVAAENAQLRERVAELEAERSRLESSR